MGIHFYWISTITYAFVLGVFFISDLRVARKTSYLEKSYHLMVLWVIIFCIQDTIWGLCADRVINNDDFFFLSSSVFHMSTVITTFFWLKYVLDYLGDNVRHKRLYLTLDGIVIGFEFLLVLANLFKPTLFRIVDGNYIVGDYRAFTFFNQYAVYVIIGIITLVYALKKETKDLANYRTVFLFSLAPIMLGVCQLLFPEAPFYSLGYFLGCIIIHTFVVLHDREVYLSEEEKLQKIIRLNGDLEKKQAEIDEQFDILKAFAGIYEYINLVDFDTKTASRFDVKDLVVECFDIVNDPHTSLDKKLAPLIERIDRDRFLEYTDLSTLNEKMMGKKYISGEFKCTTGDWIRAIYIRIGEDINHPIGKVAYGYKNITSDRKHEEQIYSALTILFYSLHIVDLENDTMERLIESDLFKQIVGDETSAQKMANTIIRETCKDEFLDMMLKFVDLSTVGKRIKKKEYITSEFVGKYHGWMRMTFVPMEKSGDDVKKMFVATEIIDSEKNELLNLMYKSSTDELTRLYNRRTYEEDLNAIIERNNINRLVIIAMDVNGLKTVNDTIGHKAGDELIVGASKCINDSFSSVGRVYRTGGDEFMAILRCDTEELLESIARFDKSIEEWSGEQIGSLSISYGFAAVKDYPDLGVRDLTSKADRLMYEAKAAHYEKKGINRRRQ